MLSTTTKKLMVIPVLLFLSGACSSTADQSTGVSKSSEVSSSEDFATNNDPGIFSDVISSAFPVPGPSRGRMRVENFTSDALNVSCGYESSGDFDATDGRSDQAYFADLELIAEKGLTEEPKPRAGGEDSNYLGCDPELLPSRDDFLTLLDPWFQETLTAIESDAVTATEPETAECLTERSGTEVDRSKPTETYLLNIDIKILDKPGGEERQSEIKRLSDVFVECSGPYFEAIAGELIPARNRLVERNRELIERYATELADAGYVP